MGDWVNELCNLFSQEIELYKKMKDLEEDKKSAINRADGKALQELAKSTYNFMVNASELERVRMNSIEEVYKKQGLTKESEGITLSHFLNQIDRDSNFKLKGYATELKTVVHKLKESIILNEKLMLTRQELLKKTVEEMQKSQASTTYSPKEKHHVHKSHNKVKSLVLDASA